LAANVCLKAAAEKIKEWIFLNLVAMAKLFCSQTAMDTTIEAVQIHGGNGYVEYVRAYDA
jgi:alkylation response protein AidB-like acyl-CoA dehydrogenase